MTMDVDKTPVAETRSERILVHPLAIVNMSDQFTRITYGGSPLPVEAPVTGLLFGSQETVVASQQVANDPANKKNTDTSSSTTTTAILQIVDAEDIPVDLSEAALLQEELHRAVFPLHKVIGWYRVSQSDQVQEQDLILTEKLAQHYCSSSSTSSSTGEGTTTGTTSCSMPFVFALLVVKDSNNKTSSSHPTSTNDDNDNDDNNNEEETPDSLPLTLYKKGDNVLQALEEWALETSDSERIAVERVMGEQQPQQQQQQSQQKQQQPESTTDQKEHDEDTVTLLLSHSRFIQHSQTLEQSLQAIHDRMSILEQFLDDTAKGNIPFDPSLMRKVQGLLLQLGGCAKSGASTTTTASSSTSATPTPLLFQDDKTIPVAFLAKTVEAVQSYTEKFRLIHEAAHSSAGGGGGRPREVRRY